jgi:hypothetical protein
MKINDRKQKIIQKTKRVNFRQKIEKIFETITSLWRFVKWAKNKRHQWKENFKMIILKFNVQTIKTFDEKTKIFKSVFFSTSSSIELDDISKSFYFRSIDCSFSITKRKMLKIIKQIVLDKISNLNEIINKLLKICALIMMQLLISLFVVCIQQTYHSKTFKKVNIITLKKLDKKNYTISKTYWSIAFLNIIEKILKFIMNKKISWITKIHRLVFETFMKCRQNRSIETTLKFFIEQIHIVWKQRTNRMITLLNLNATNVFDTMSHVRLIHDMKKRKFRAKSLTELTVFCSITSSFSQWIEEWSNRSRCRSKFRRVFRFLRFYISSIMSIYWNCATNSKRTRDFSSTSMMSTVWSTKRASTKTVEISKECTNFAIDQRFDMSSCLSRSSMNWFTSSKARKSSTWRSRSRSIRTRFNRRSTFEFSTCKSTHDWNEIHTYKKSKKKWRNKSWFSRNCRLSSEKRSFERLECCTSSLFARFSLTTSLFDTCSRIKNLKWSTNSQLYKIFIYETSSNRFQSSRFRFWKLKRMSFLSICIWINYKLKSNIACESQTYRALFVKNANQ